MSAARKTLSSGQRAHNRPPGLFSRVPFVVQRGLERLRPPSSARLAIDAVLDHVVGLDGDRLSVEGVPLSVRALAHARERHATTIQRGLTWALRRGVLARRPDPEVRGGYLYAVAHPSRW